MIIGYLWNRIIKKARGKAIVGSFIDRSSKVEAGSTIINCEMDRYSFCGYNCKVINCKIGAFCSIADEVYIGGARHPIEWVSTSPVFYQGRDSVKKKFSVYKRPDESKTVIGNDVWIGDRALIKEGVKIGNGAVIGMGSVVTKDVGDYEIWAGNPAHFIRKRFDDKTISGLNASKWWSKTDKEIETLAKYIVNPEDFINEI